MLILAKNRLIMEVSTVTAELFYLAFKFRSFTCLSEVGWGSGRLRMWALEIFGLCWMTWAIHVTLFRF